MLYLDAVAQLRPPICGFLDFKQLVLYLDFSLIIIYMLSYFFITYLWPITVSSRFSVDKPVPVMEPRKKRPKVIPGVISSPENSSLDMSPGSSPLSSRSAPTDTRDDAGIFIYSSLPQFTRKISTIVPYLFVPPSLSLHVAMSVEASSEGTEPTQLASASSATSNNPKVPSLPSSLPPSLLPQT